MSYLMTILKLRFLLVKRQFNISRLWEKLLLVMIFALLIFLLKWLTGIANDTFLMYALLSSLFVAFGLFDTGNRKISTSEVKMTLFFFRIDRKMIRIYFRYKRLIMNIIVLSILLFPINFQTLSTALFFFITVALAMIACSLSYKYLPSFLADLVMVLIRVGYWVVFTRLTKSIEMYMFRLSTPLLMAIFILTVAINFFVLPNPKFIEVKNAPITL